MATWEYSKIDLNSAQRETDDIDLLNDMGKRGWELVHIGSNKIAYVKRQIAKEAATTGTSRRASKRPLAPATAG